jgi:hypothetical protein
MANGPMQYMDDWIHLLLGIPDNDIYESAYQLSVASCNTLCCFTYVREEAMYIYLPIAANSYQSWNHSIWAHRTKAHSW